MLVWLTNWQIEEDHRLITVGDTVDWTLYPADRDWVRRLFGDRLVIEWQFDSAHRSIGTFRCTASYASAWNDPEAESLYGYVATLT
jgi:hypothetical protein